MRTPDTKYFLPITKKEMDALGWDYVDVVLISGDAYVDHPSFCTAVIGRTLQKAGYRVAIVPQPNWKDDLRETSGSVATMPIRPAAQLASAPITRPPFTLIFSRSCFPMCRSSLAALRPR